jgi:hypothetical protein
MESPIKLTGQGIRDLNDRGPKKKPAVAADAGALVGDTVALAGAPAVEGAPVAMPTPVTDDATTPAVAHNG